MEPKSYHLSIWIIQDYYSGKKSIRKFIKVHIIYLLGIDQEFEITMVKCEYQIPMQFSTQFGYGESI